MKIKKCVITIAGFGTRLLPITKTISKEMIPIIDLPVIFYQVKEAYLSGIEEIIFVVSKRNIDLIKNFFSIDNVMIKEIKDDPKKANLLDEVNEIINNMKFTYVIQKIRGTYGSLYSAKDLLGNEPFALMYGDDLVVDNPPLLKQMISIYEKTKQSVVAVRYVEEDKLPKFGIIEYKNGNILKNICYKDKVNPSQDIILGRFILNPSIFTVKDKLVIKSKELQLPKALLYINEDVQVLKLKGKYFDMGNKLEYIKATLYFGLQRKEFHDDLRKYMKEIEKNNWRKINYFF